MVNKGANTNSILREQTSKNELAFSFLAKDNFLHERLRFQNMNRRSFINV